MANQDYRELYEDEIHEAMELSGEDPEIALVILEGMGIDSLDENDLEAVSSGDSSDKVDLED